MFKRVLIILITVVLVSLIFPISAYAASATFSINPSAGRVKVGSKFYTDIMIDTNGEAVTLARAVLTFDPTILKAVKVQRNASLFCTYPNAQQSVDNKYGVIVLTGFCQSGTGDPYTTIDGEDVYARIQWQVLKAGTIQLKWEYNGKDAEFKSAIVQDGSPSQNILTTKPGNATFSTSTVITPNAPTTPTTGLFLSWSMIVFGSIFVILGIAVTIYSLRHGISSKMRTVVVRE